MSYREATVYIDGKFVKGEDAKISVWDHAVLYGDAVFDTARVYDGKIFKLDEHIDRLFDSAKGLTIKPPVDAAKMKEIVVETVKRNAITSGQIRIISHPGRRSSGNRSHDLSQGLDYCKCSAGSAHARPRRRASSYFYGTQEITHLGGLQNQIDQLHR